MKKARRGMSSLIVYGVTLITLIILFFICLQQVDRDNHTPFEITLVNDPETGAVDEQRGISISVTNGKDWPDLYKGMKQVGAEYDGVIQNNNSYPISDWTLQIKTPVIAGRLDSTWNGTYSAESGVIHAVPDEFTCIIPPGESRTFGFVMYSPIVYQMDEFTFSAYLNREITEYPTFWGVVLGAFIWVVGLICSLVISLRMRRIKQRAAQDENIISQTMTTFAGLIDAKDEYTRGHSVRVAEYSQLIGKKLHLKEDEIRKLGYIALMHDCGKMGVPDLVLNKPDKLLAEERRIIEAHTKIGGRILENFNAIEGIREGALYHHERYDGKGYPEGLAGEAIPYYARIICVADSFDAMSSDRCYRKHLPKDVILGELEKCAGTQFDPAMVKVMIELIHEGAITVAD